MKKFRNITIAHLVIVGSLGLLTYQAKSDLEVSVGVEVHAVGDFHDPLVANGAWVEVGSYGQCWRPRGVAVDWRPYCDGHWEWTDCGWFWETDEPWGWACYHYGTWVEDPSLGWCWVPGIEWAPAWVVWRGGGDYIGWAPCAPAGVVVVPGFFVFINANHFGNPITRSTVVINNDVVFRQTSSIGGAKRESRNIGGRSQNVVINNGPEVATVEKASGRKFSPVSIQEAVRKAPAPANFRTSQPGKQPAASDQRPAVQPENRPSVEPRSGERNVQPSPRAPAERPIAPSPDIKPAPSTPQRPTIPSPDVKPAPRPERPTPPAREDRPASPPREERPAEPPKEERPASPPAQDNQRGRGDQGALPTRSPFLWAEMRLDAGVYRV